MKTRNLLIVLLSMVYLNFIPYNSKQMFVNHAEENIVANENIWSKSFDGLIDGKYQIYMRLNNKNGTLSGYYFYKSAGKDLQLRGKISENGEVHVKEINSKDKTTGIFTGELKKNLFKGTWENADRTKKFSFSLEKKTYSTNCDEVTMKKEKLKLIDDELMTVTVPKVSAANKGLQKRLSYLLSAEKLTGRTVDGLNELIKEYKENMMPHGIVEYDYDVNYNKNCLLSLTGVKVTLGAHFYYYQENINLELSSGLDVQITDIIKKDKMEQLAELCNQKLQEAINNTIDADYLKDTPDLVNMLKSNKFTVNNLSQFIIRDDNLVFFYDYALPHVYRHATPDTDISFHFDDLKDYAKPDGALHFIF